MCGNVLENRTREMDRNVREGERERECVCVCMCVCMCFCTYTCMFVFFSLCVDVCLQGVCVCVCFCTYTCMFVFFSLCVDVCLQGVRHGIFPPIGGFPPIERPHGSFLRSVQIR